MKMFKCDNELESVLIKSGFIDVTSDKDRSKGKKEFRISRNSRFKILFNYHNFTFIEGIYISTEFKMSTIREDELKLLIGYIKDLAFRKEIKRTYGRFHIDGLKKLYESLKFEHDFYQTNGIRSNKLNKFVIGFESISRIDFNN